MSHIALTANPFMLLMNPEAVVAAVEKSERLAQLRRHLCRPLDRPLLGAGCGDDDGDDDAMTSRIDD